MKNTLLILVVLSIALVAGSCRPPAPQAAPEKETSAQSAKDSPAPQTEKPVENPVVPEETTEGVTGVGDMVPAVSLPDQDGKQVSLEDFRGQWVVLYFYPKDGTPGCTIEACDFTDARPDFDDLGAMIVGCSPDSPESHRAFIADQKLNLTLLSDEDRRLIEDFGVWGERNVNGKTFEGVIRSTYIIDPSGRIVHEWKPVDVEGHADAVHAKLRELRG
jgi:peroxiredoxin Q/BCP